MGSGNVEVVDVSSDEEPDKDYLEFLLNNKSVHDSTDEVEVVSSVDSQLNSSTQAALEEDDEDEDDDDCVILDCDPVKTSDAVEAEAHDDDDDEVLVVGQKGEIACRDFPHPRHSCAKYSFNSTSHESYCDMCHCYVCDIPAPCPYWCVAVSSIIDHCHANDKDKTWKNQREYFRTGNIPSTPPAHATVSPPQSIIRLSQQNPSPRNKIEIRPCSVRGRNSRVRQSLSSSSVVIQKDKSSNLRSRVASSGSIKVGGLYTNAKVSQSTTHLNNPLPPEMYTQQQQQRNCAAVTTESQSNSADLFRVPEWCSTVQQQQPGTNENILQTKLSEVESWLMDSCNQAGLDSPLTEPVAQDSVTFDFETFLND